MVVGWKVDLLGIERDKGRLSFDFLYARRVMIEARDEGWKPRSCTVSDKENGDQGEEARVIYTCR